MAFDPTPPRPLNGPFVWGLIGGRGGAIWRLAWYRPESSGGNRQSVVLLLGFEPRGPGWNCHAGQPSLHATRQAIVPAHEPDGLRRDVRRCRGPLVGQPFA